MATQKRRSEQAGRNSLRSPGRPPAARREDHRRFWAAIAAGRSSEDAAAGTRVSPAVGVRWFRRGGGNATVTSHAAGYNLGQLMRLLVGAGTPREFLAGASAHLLLLTTAEGVAFVILIAASNADAATLVVSFEPEPQG